LHRRSTSAAAGSGRRPAGPTPGISPQRAPVHRRRRPASWGPPACAAANPAAMQPPLQLAAARAPRRNAACDEQRAAGVSGLSGRRRRGGFGFAHMPATMPPPAQARPGPAE
jgi:hypothetical protein